MILLKSEDLYLLYLIYPGFNQIQINYWLDRVLPVGIKLIVDGYFPKMHSIAKICFRDQLEIRETKVCDKNIMKIVKFNNNVLPTIDI